MTVTIPETNINILTEYSMGTMNIGIPELILLGLIIFNLCFAMAKHGESKGNYNAFLALVDVAILLPLLWWGGFFS